MSKTSTFEVAFKRRRKEKTNYKKRLALVKSFTPRLVVRKSNRHTVCHVVEFDLAGDKTLCFATSKELKKFGWNKSTKNTPSAYLTGYLCGLRAKKLDLKETILDIGLHSPIHGSRIFSCLKGFIDAGVKVPVGESVFPKQERIEGKHIQKLESGLFEKVLKEIQSKNGGLNG